MHLKPAKLMLVVVCILSLFESPLMGEGRLSFHFVEPLEEVVVSQCFESGPGQGRLEVADYTCSGHTLEAGGIVG